MQIQDFLSTCFQGAYNLDAGSHNTDQLLW